MSNDRYWSSSTFADDTVSAWNVTMYGGPACDDKSDAYYVWPVRAGQ